MPLRTLSQASAIILALTIGACAHRNENVADTLVEGEPEIDPSVIEAYQQDAILRRTEKLDFSTPLSRSAFVSSLELGSSMGSLNSGGERIEIWDADGYSIEAIYGKGAGAQNVTGVRVFEDSEMIYKAPTPTVAETADTPASEDPVDTANAENTILPELEKATAPPASAISAPPGEIAPENF